jgi:hypothetical protein
LEAFKHWLKRILIVVRIGVRVLRETLRGHQKSQNTNPKAKQTQKSKFKIQNKSKTQNLKSAKSRPIMDRTTILLWRKNTIRLRRLLKAVCSFGFGAL